MRERKFVGVVKRNTPLLDKLKVYISWKYEDLRGINVALIQADGFIKVTTSLFEAPSLQEKRNSVLTEWINPAIMNAEIRQNNLL
jgi:hypothetical protein